MAPRLQVRTVKNKEDRKRPSVFLRLKTDEQFRGYPLFEPDPELDDNPGFYEYFSHWDKQASTYVPCAGEKCPFCRANDNPGTQAMTLWYFPDNDEKEKLKVFTMNFGTLRDITDIAEEDGGIIGKKFRVKRLTDKGEYVIRPLTDKPLTQKQVATYLSDAPDLEAMSLRQLQTQWERLKAMDALEDSDSDDDADSDDEDDDDEQETKTAKGGKAKAAAVEADDEDEDEDEDEDDSGEDEDEDEDKDEAEDEDADEDEAEDEADEDAALEGVSLEVVKVDESNEIVTAKNSDNARYEIWLAEGLEVDFEKVKKGVTITVDAVKDDEGDWVATKLAPKTARRKAAAK